MIAEKWLFSLGFIFLIVALSIATPFLPWWRVYSSREYEIDTNTTIKIEYYLSGSISASRKIAGQNESLSITIPISELNATENSKKAIQSLFTTVRYLTIAGSGLNLLILVLLCISYARSLSTTFKYIKYTNIVIAILFFAAFLYFASEIQPLISTLQYIAPVEVCILSGNSIKSLFGNTSSLNYGPSLGWYLALAVFLLNLSFYMLIENIKKPS